MDTSKIMQILRDTAYVRTGGSQEELRCARYLADCCAQLGYPPQHGRFGADMKVESINDGPVTLILDTDQLMNEPRRP